MSAIAAIDADVVGLIEIENSATDAAVATLVTALNDDDGSRDLCTTSRPVASEPM